MCDNTAAETRTDNRLGKGGVEGLWMNSAGRRCLTVSHFRLSASFRTRQRRAGSLTLSYLHQHFPKCLPPEPQSHKIFYHKRALWANNFGKRSETQCILTPCKTFLIVTRRDCKVFLGRNVFKVLSAFYSLNHFFDRNTS